MRQKATILKIGQTNIALSFDEINLISRLNSSFNSKLINLNSKYREKKTNEGIDIAFSLVASFLDKKGEMEYFCQFDFDTSKQTKHLYYMKKNQTLRRNNKSCLLSTKEDLYNDLINFFDSLSSDDSIDAISKEIISFAIIPFKHEGLNVSTRPKYVDESFEISNNSISPENTNTKK